MTAIAFNALNAASPGWVFDHANANTANDTINFVPVGTNSAFATIPIDLSANPAQWNVPSNFILAGEDADESLYFRFAVTGFTTVTLAVNLKSGGVANSLVGGPLRTWPTGNRGIQFRYDLATHTLGMWSCADATATSPTWVLVTDGSENGDNSVTPRQAFPGAVLSDIQNNASLQMQQFWYTGAGYNGGANRVFGPFVNPVVGPTPQIRTRVADGKFETAASWSGSVIPTVGDWLDLAGHTCTIDTATMAALAGVTNALNGSGEVVLGNWSTYAVRTNGGTLTITTGAKVRNRGGWAVGGASGSIVVNGGSLTMDSGTGFHQITTNPDSSPSTWGRVTLGNGASPAASGTQLTIVTTGTGGYWFGDDNASGACQVYIDGLVVTGPGFRDANGTAFRPTNRGGYYTGTAHFAVQRADLTTCGSIRPDSGLQPNDYFTVSDEARISAVHFQYSHAAIGSSGFRRLAAGVAKQECTIGTLRDFEFGSINHVARADSDTLNLMTALGLTLTTAQTSALQSQLFGTPAPFLFETYPKLFEGTMIDGDASAWKGDAWGAIRAVRTPNAAKDCGTAIPGVWNGLYFGSCVPSVAGFDNFNALYPGGRGAPVRGTRRFAVSLSSSLGANGDQTSDPFAPGFGTDPVGTSVTPAIYLHQNVVQMYDARGKTIGNLQTHNGIGTNITVITNRFVYVSDTTHGEAGILLNHNAEANHAGYLMGAANGIVLAPKDRSTNAVVNVASITWNNLGQTTTGAFQGVDRIGVRGLATAYGSKPSLGNGSWGGSITADVDTTGGFSNPIPANRTLTLGDPALVNEYADLDSWYCSLKGLTLPTTSSSADIDQRAAYRDLAFLEMTKLGTPGYDSRFTLMAYLDYIAAAMQPTASAFLTAGTGGTPLGVTPPGGFALPVVTLGAFSAPAQNEGNAGSGTGFTTFVAPVTRSGNTAGTSSVAWAVTGSGSNPANAADFIGSAFPSGTVTFGAGETSKTITVGIFGDTVYEPDEMFTVTLSSPTNCTIGTATTSGTILNDDPVVTLDTINAKLDTLIAAINAAAFVPPTGYQIPTIPVGSTAATNEVTTTGLTSVATAVTGAQTAAATAAATAEAARLAAVAASAAATTASSKADAAKTSADTAATTAGAVQARVNLGIDSTGKVVTSNPALTTTGPDAPMIATALLTLENNRQAFRQVGAVVVGIAQTAGLQADGTAGHIDYAVDGSNPPIIIAQSNVLPGAPSGTNTFTVGDTL